MPLDKSQYTGCAKNQTFSKFNYHIYLHITAFHISNCSVLYLVCCMSLHLNFEYSLHDFSVTTVRKPAQLSAYSELTSINKKNN